MHAAYCQVLDSLFTDEFPLRRVCFTAKVSTANPE